MLCRLSCIAAYVFAVTVGALADVEVHIQLQHNLGGGFVDAASITGIVDNEIQHKSPLRIDWRVPETAVAELKELVERDGMYQLRIEGNTGKKLAGDVLVSLPARCFEASLRARNRLDMHATVNGELMGIQWRFERTLDCSPEARVDIERWPTTSKATVHIPVPGPDISDLASSLIDDKYSEKLSAAYSDIKNGGKQPEVSDKEKQAQKERTFWEKNWMFVLAGAMLLFNVVATKPPPQGRPPAS